MKKTWVSLMMGSAALLAILASWAPPASAQAPAPGGKPAEVATSPLGRLCVVTLDPRIDRGAKAAGESFKKAGVTADSTVEGTLVTWDQEWIMLRDGTYENWIPRDKVLMIRVSR